MMLFPEPPRTGRQQAISPSTSPGSVFSAPDYGSSPPRTAYTTPAPAGPGTRFPSGPLPILDKDNKSLSFKTDFILLSEFSEQEGPIPLHVIPSGAQGSFNLNEFVLRIMAVDYQSQNAFAETGVLPDDTQFILSERDENCHAYVHHFTLHDLSARGYVRPFALSYVTADRSKIMSYFDHLVKAFSRVTAAWKIQNRRVFLHDLRDRVADLHFTRTLLLEEERAEKEEGKETTEGEDSDANAAARGLMTVTAVGDILQEMETALTRISVKTGKLVLSESYDDDIARDDAVTLTQLPGYEPKRLETLAKRNFSRKLRNVPELTQIEPSELSRRLKHIHRRFRRSCLSLRVEAYETALCDPDSSLLTSGPSVLLNFNPTADRRIRDVAPVYERKMSRLSRENPLFNVDHQSSDEDSDSSEGAMTFSASSSVASYQDALEDFPSEYELFEGRTKADSSASDRFHHAASIGDLSSLGGDQSVMSIRKTSTSGIGSPHATVATDGTADESIWDPDPRTPLRSFLYHIEFFRRSHIGRGILHLRDNISFTRHLIYALLKGRTVIVLGSSSNERGVRSLINTLSLFVLGTNHRAKVRKWSTRPLTMAALGKLKLIGQSKSTPIPKHLEQYVSVFDLETEVCTTPVYSGTILEDMFSPRTRWPDETSFVAHIHHQLLEVACKAFQLYHLSLIGVIPEANTPTTDRYPAEWDVDASDYSAEAAKSTSRQGGQEAPGSKGKGRQTTTQSQPAQSPASTLAKERGLRRERSLLGEPDVDLDVDPHDTKQRASSATCPPPAGESAWDLAKHAPVRQSPLQVLARLGIRDPCDVEIVQYMCEVVMHQQEEALRNQGVLPRLANPVVRLDTGAPVLLRNVKAQRTPRLGVVTRRASAATTISTTYGGSDAGS